MAEKPPLGKLKPGQSFVPEVSNEHALSVGKIVIAWSKLEAAVEDAIWTILGLPADDGRLVTKRLNAEGKIHMFKAALDRHMKEQTKKRNFKEFMKDIDSLKEDRNFIAHGVWGTIMPDGIPIAISLKPKAEDGKVIAETFPPGRMNAILEGIDASRDKFIKTAERAAQKRRG